MANPDLTWETTITRNIGLDWALFGAQCIVLCEEYKRAYYIKEDLRKELEAAG